MAGSATTDRQKPRKRPELHGWRGERLGDQEVGEELEFGGGAGNRESGGKPPHSKKSVSSSVNKPPHSK